MQCTVQAFCNQSYTKTCILSWVIIYKDECLRMHGPQQFLLEGTMQSEQDVGVLQQPVCEDVECRGRLFNSDQDYHLHPLCNVFPLLFWTWLDCCCSMYKNGYGFLQYKDDGCPGQTLIFGQCTRTMAPGPGAKIHQVPAQHHHYLWGWLWRGGGGRTLVDGGLHFCKPRDIGK